MALHPFDLAVEGRPLEAVAASSPLDDGEMAEVLSTAPDDGLEDRSDETKAAAVSCLKRSRTVLAWRYPVEGVAAAGVIGAVAGDVVVLVSHAAAVVLLGWELSFAT